MFKSDRMLRKMVYSSGHGYVNYYPDGKMQVTLERGRYALHHYYCKVSVRCQDDDYGLILYEECETLSELKVIFREHKKVYDEMPYIVSKSWLLNKGFDYI